MGNVEAKDIIAITGGNLGTLQMKGFKQEIPTRSCLFDHWLTFSTTVSLRSERAKISLKLFQWTTDYTSKKSGTGPNEWTPKTPKGPPYPNIMVYMSLDVIH